VPLPAASVAAAARQSLPSNEPQSGSTVRPPTLLDDEDEATRGAQRPPHRSNPVASPPPQAAPEGRATLEAAGGESARALIDAVGSLVERVARAFAANELEADVGPELATRVEQKLQEGWAALSLERASLASLPAEKVLGVARSELLELGPLEELISDVNVSEIAVLGCDRLTFVRSGRANVAEVAFSSAFAVRWAVARLCARSEAPLGRATRVQRRLADGSALTAVLESSGAPLVFVTRQKRVVASLDELVRRGTVSRAVSTFLQQCLTARLNVLVVGPRDGGVELLTAALAAAVGESEIVAAGGTSAERFGSGIALNGASAEFAETVVMAARAPLTRLFADLSSAALTQAIVGAACDGCDGIVAARTATSAARGLMRLSAELRPRYADGAIEAIAGAFEVVVEIARLRDDRHRVLRVAEVLGADAREVTLSDIFTFTIDRTAAGGLIEGSFMPSSNMPAVADMLRTRGAPIDTALFVRPAAR